MLLYIIGVLGATLLALDLLVLANLWGLLIMTKYSSQDIGPTWYDVEELVCEFRDRFGLGVDFELRPPTVFGASGKRSSWSVFVRVWRAGTVLTAPITNTQSFGRGGSHRTAPGAIHMALRLLWEQCDGYEPLTGKELVRALQGHQNDGGTP